MVHGNPNHKIFFKISLMERGRPNHNKILKIFLWARGNPFYDLTDEAPQRPEPTLHIKLGGFSS